MNEHQQEIMWVLIMTIILLATAWLVLLDCLAHA